MKERVPQLDFLKGFFILLVVIYHNHVISDFTSEILCAVHMPAFLIISGYLANVDKDVPSFCKGMLRLLVPYAIFETMYVVMLFLLGKVMNASNQIEELSPFVLLDKLFLNPEGTYWYLHTLIICTVMYYVVCHVLKLKSISALAVMGAALFGLSLVIGRLEMSNVIYFLMVVFIAMSGRGFVKVITPSALAVVPLILLIGFSDDFSRGTLAGVGIPIFSISLLLFAFDHCLPKVKKTFMYLGRNSLAMVIFSPIFTIICSRFIPYFKFDPTHLLFAIFSLVISVEGCMLCAWISDKLGFSRFLFYKEKFYASYKTISD